MSIARRPLSRVGSEDSASSRRGITCAFAAGGRPGIPASISECGFGERAGAPCCPGERCRREEGFLGRRLVAGAQLGTAQREQRFSYAGGHQPRLRCRPPGLQARRQGPPSSYARSRAPPVARPAGILKGLARVAAGARFEEVVGELG